LLALSAVLVGSAGPVLEQFGIRLPKLSAAVRGCGCFPDGTAVATPHGSTPIEQLKVGDQVLAEDPSTGKVEPERVQAVIDDGVKPTMRVGLSDGSAQQVTTNHPFYVDGGPGAAAPQWVQAGDLRVGDRIRTEDGQDITVAALRYNTGNAHVYTLTVATDHDFFVGSARVLVHNCPGLSPAAAEQAVTGTGIQHGFNHVKGQLGLGNWNKSSGAALSNIVKDVLTNPEAVVQNWTQAKGQEIIDIYIKTVQGHPLAVYVNQASGQVRTTVIAGAGQLANWGVVL